MTREPAIEAGRRAFERQSWQEAYDRLAEADRRKRLGPADLAILATTAYLTGRDEESTELWSRAHQAFLDEGAVPDAVRAAFWLAYGLLNRGESERGGGWLHRAARLLDEGGVDCVEAGYLLLPRGIGAVGAGDPAKAEGIFEQAARVGQRFGDRDLVTLARQGRGRALIRKGEIEAGVAFLDEAMAAVDAGEVSAIVAGDTYCSVIEGCQEIQDLRRAHAWTDALSDWCESQTGLVPFRGQCLVRRAELMQLHGAWSRAMDEAERAGDELTRPPGRPAAAEAFYRQAELHRLRGELGAAEEAYREAARWSRKPRPGLALLRLAQGRLDTADATIRRVLAEARTTAERSAVLPAYVEIVLAAGDLEAARAGADDLRTVAEEIGSLMSGARAAEADGAVCVAEGDPRGALDRLRTAWAGWEELEAPYEAARVRVLIAAACRRLGDHDGAAVEVDAARRTFERLGAATDLERMAGPGSGKTPPAAHGLTGRELQVLQLVASGRTNKAVAEELSISERTVERHVSNVLRKLRVSSRTAATAWAYEHDVV